MKAYVAPILPSMKESSDNVVNRNVIPTLFLLWAFIR